MVAIIIFILLMSICSVVCISLGRYIALGKGDNLIAGYNSTSEEEKDKYDVVRVRRVTAWSLYFVSIILPLFGIVAFLPENSAMLATFLLAGLSIAVLILGVVWGDRWSRRR